LDDFGTGYSPLSYLRRLPVDLIKIDRSFITDIVRNREDQAIVRGVVEMAHALGLRALAEGIEDDEQLALLRSLGCDLAQGYFWLRPSSLSDVAAWLALPNPRTASDGSPDTARRERSIER
jgi:EAL domain-containing protein (putative c-di-GMP-specific phosphodiesterase class I)